MSSVDIPLLTLDPLLKGQKVDSSSPLLPKRGTTNATPHQVEPAEEYSWLRRVLMIGWAFWGELTISLVITGWPAFLPVLVADGAYFELCNANTTVPFGINNISTCEEQQVHLSYMSTVALGVQNSCSPAAGFINDLWGPRATTGFGACFALLGFLLLSFANSRTFNVYILSWSLLAVGGQFSIICHKHLANLFPEKREILITLMFALGQCSNGWLYIFQLLYFKLGLAFPTISRIYLIFPLLFIGMALLQPPRPVVSKKVAHKESFTPVFHGVLHICSSLQFAICALWIVINATTTYFYITMLTDQLNWLFPHSPETANDLAEVFSIVFLFMPLIGVPFIGNLLSKFGVYFGLCFAGTLLGANMVLSLIPNYGAQILNFLLFIVGRSSVWCILGHYTNIMFGVYFSRMLAIFISTSGIGIFTNLGWSKLTMDTLQGDFFGVIIAMGVASTASCWLFAYFAYTWRTPRAEIHIE